MPLFFNVLLANKNLKAEAGGEEYRALIRRTSIRAITYDVAALSEMLTLNLTLDVCQKRFGTYRYSYILCI